MKSDFITLKSSSVSSRHADRTCEICGAPAAGLDHDHETGKGRGWLCSPCNSGIGQFHDNPQLLRAAAAYLERTEGLPELTYEEYLREKHREDCRRWAQENADKVRETNRRYRLEHPDRVREYRRRHYAKHRERVLAQQREFLASLPPEELKRRRRQANQRQKAKR
jgi:hypothetical protein